MSDFNSNHPEKKEGEVWVTNATKEEFEGVRWKTKRLGEVAYDYNGKVVNLEVRYFPVFVQRRELKPHELPR